jgi:hypothetical protein
VQITIDLPHVFHPGSTPEDNAHVLRALLDCLIRSDAVYLRRHAAPSLYGSGVRYGRTKKWDSVPAVLSLGYGDCKSLTAWRIAELSLQGQKATPVFRWVKRGDASGAVDFHILVLREDGAFEDPSKVLGMGHNENEAFRR